MADVAATIAGLDALGARVDEAVFQIVADGLHLVQATAMGIAPVGTAGNTTNPPGDLARSIDVEGPAGGDGVYAGRVGPTVIYGRQRELGGDIYPQRAKALHFWKFGEEVYTRHVYQHPEPYMRPAEMESIPSIELIALDHIASAIAGS